MSFGEDASTSRTVCGPVNLAAIRVAVIAASKDAGYLHIPEGGATIPPPPPPKALHLHGLD